MTGPLGDRGPRPIGESFTSGPLAYGCWRLTTESTDDAQALIEAAIDTGLNLIDTADVYGFDWGGTGFGQNEEKLGQVLAQAPQLRDRMVLATKGGILPPLPYDSSADYLTEACEASLRRLGVDTIDLYQIHRPDLFTHPAEVAATLVALRDAGKIVEVGVSNHTPAQYEALKAHLPFPIATNQPELSAANTSALRDGTLDLCMRDGVTPMAWSPLAGGRLAIGIGVRAALVDVLDRLAEREGVGRADVALAFVLAHPSRPVAIIGTQNIDRVRSAPAALDVKLDRNDVYAIIEASEAVPLP